MKKSLKLASRRDNTLELNKLQKKKEYKINPFKIIIYI